MHAIKLKTMIDQTHRLQIDLPADTPQGEAEVIVLVSTLDAGLHAQGGRHRRYVLSALQTRALARGRAPRRRPRRHGNAPADHFSRPAATRTGCPLGCSASACARRHGPSCVDHCAASQRATLRRCRIGHTPPWLPVCDRIATAQPGSASIGIADTSR